MTLQVVKKIDNINIILKHKFGGIYNRKSFFIRKKVYISNLYILYNLNR